MCAHLDLRKLDRPLGVCPWIHSKSKQINVQYYSLITKKAGVSRYVCNVMLNLIQIMF